MENLNYAKCPRCGRTSEGRKEIQVFFGYRKMKDGTLRVQSWCRKCREKNVATCPNCGKTAKGQGEIKKLFGFRKMGDGLTRVQSWCRECRSIKK